MELIHLYNTRQASMLSNLEPSTSTSSSATSLLDEWTPRPQELDERFAKGLQLSENYLEEWDKGDRIKFSSPISTRLSSIQYQVSTRRLSSDGRYYLSSAGGPTT